MESKMPLPGFWSEQVGGGGAIHSLAQAAGGAG